MPRYACMFPADERLENVRLMSSHARDIQVICVRRLDVAEELVFIKSFMVDPERKVKIDGGKVTDESQEGHPADKAIERIHLLLKLRTGRCRKAPFVCCSTRP